MSTIIPKAKRMANGIVSAAMMAVRRSPRKTRSNNSTSAMPVKMRWRTVSVVM